ncbi:hypothetical protein HMPREF1426_00647 [Helicobacter pylori GAM80Ai]|nr:hypothetical protein HMPREF1426_00647 [Helicobacter pylori GAM80Ai]
MGIFCICFFLFYQKYPYQKRKKINKKFLQKPMFWFNLIVTILFVIGFVGELHIIQRLVSKYL